ncbi:MAG: GNAT family N-acetyltransferase [Corynebacteriales bacterium]|nr:GNAT family N-acetyltransferase [Mycobacteriales bacterium]
MRQNGLVSGEFIRLEPWDEGDLALLRRINTPEMRKYVGGPETEAQVLARHSRYLNLKNGRMFRIELLPEGEHVGSIAFWNRIWRGEEVYETGWNVLPEFQGRGIGMAAVHAIINTARHDNKHRWLHAYPSVNNAASNAICRKAGFELAGETDFEYPPGQIMRSHDWRFDLHL